MYIYIYNTVPMNRKPANKLSDQSGPQQITPTGSL